MNFDLDNGQTLLYFGLMPRLPRDFDWNEINDWFKVQCSVQDVCDMLTADWRVLNRACYRENKISITEHGAKWNAIGKAMIRRVLFDRAMEKSKGSDAMARYLDKKYLGGLPPDQQPAPAQIGSQVFIQNNPQALPPGQNVVDLLATILGKKSEPKLIEAK